MCATKSLDDTLFHSSYSTERSRRFPAKIPTLEDEISTVVIPGAIDGLISRQLEAQAKVKQEVVELDD